MIKKLSFPLWSKSSKKKRKKIFYPIASNVSSKDRRDDEAAAWRFGAFHWITLPIPITEVVNPTTPAMSDKITTKPVAMFPNG